MDASSPDEEAESTTELSSSSRSRRSAAWHPPTPRFNPMYASRSTRRMRRPSTDSDSASDYSNARTERCSYERASNETIVSFLDERNDERNTLDDRLVHLSDEAASSVLGSPKVKMLPRTAPQAKGHPSGEKGAKASKNPFEAGLALLKTEHMY